MIKTSEGGNGGANNIALLKSIKFLGKGSKSKKINII